MPTNYPYGIGSEARWLLAFLPTDVGSASTMRKASGNYDKKLPVAGESLGRRTWVAPAGHANSRVQAGVLCGEAVGLLAIALASVNPSI